MKKIIAKLGSMACTAATCGLIMTATTTPAEAAYWNPPPSCINGWDTGVYGGEAYIWNACSRSYVVKVYFRDAGGGYSHGCTTTVPADRGRYCATGAWVELTYGYIRVH